MKVGGGHAMEVGMVTLLLAMTLMLRVMVVAGVVDGGNTDGKCV